MGRCRDEIREREKRIQVKPYRLLIEPLICLILELVRALSSKCS